MSRANQRTNNSIKTRHFIFTSNANRYDNSDNHERSDPLNVVGNRFEYKWKRLLRTSEKRLDKHFNVDLL